MIHLIAISLNQTQFNVVPLDSSVSLGNCWTHDVDLSKVFDHLASWVWFLVYHATSFFFDFLHQLRWPAHGRNYIIVPRSRALH